MTSFSASIVIEASAASVWQVLADTSVWSSLYSRVNQVEGSLAVGRTLTVSTDQGRTFRSRVTQMTPNERLVLVVALPLGLFQAERIHSLKPHPQGTEFILEENFKGLLAPLITSRIPNLEPSFNEFAAALKRKVEESQSLTSAESTIQTEQVQLEGSTPEGSTPEGSTPEGSTPESST